MEGGGGGGQYPEITCAWGLGEGGMSKVFKGVKGGRRVRNLHILSLPTF